MYEYGGSQDIKWGMTEFRSRISLLNNVEINLLNAMD